MPSMQTLKGRLGRWRDALRHGRENGRVAAEAAALRALWIDAAATALPPLPQTPERPEIEVHCTSGESHSAMGLWAAWSLMRFLPRARFVLHDDGSITPETRARWTRLLPGLRICSREEGQAATAALLADARPRVLDWTRSYHYGNKLGAVQALARTSRIIEIDTDVLVFEKPEALIDAVGDPGLGVVWNRDVSYAYSYPEPALRAALGPLLGPLPDRLNSGLTMLECFTPDEWDLLEQALTRLERDPGTDPLRYWMQQTLHAIVASRRGARARPLPVAYDVYQGPTRPGAIARHFVGNPRTRPRFFTEGVPTLVRAARRAGHLPADFVEAHLPS